MIKKYSEEKRLEVINARKDGATFHRDQGRNYTSYAFRNCLREHGVHQSFSNPATPHDNAVAEAFFSVLKREELSHNWYNTPEDVVQFVVHFKAEFKTGEDVKKKLRFLREERLSPHEVKPDGFIDHFCLIRNFLLSSNGCKLVKNAFCFAKLRKYLCFKHF